MGGGDTIGGGGRRTENRDHIYIYTYIHIYIYTYIHIYIYTHIHIYILMFVIISL